MLGPDTGWVRRNGAARANCNWLSATRDRQLRLYEIGEPPRPSAHAILHRQALKDALPEVRRYVSQRRSTRSTRRSSRILSALRAKRPTTTTRALRRSWPWTRRLPERWPAWLVEVGFFERRGHLQHPTYWAPFIYRPALKLIQGSADGVAPVPGEEDSSALGH